MTKSHQKTPVFVRMACCSQTARPCCWMRSARIPDGDELFVWPLRASARAERVTFCPVTKSHQKTPGLFTCGVVRRQHVRAAGCGPRASLRAITVVQSQNVTDIKKLVKTTARRALARRTSVNANVFESSIVVVVKVFAPLLFESLTALASCSPTFQES